MNTVATYGCNEFSSDLSRNGVTACVVLQEMTGIY